jgi:hypothetical protein
MIVTIDVPCESSVAAWCEGNPDKVRTAVELGMFILVNGVDTFYKNYYEERCGAMHETKWACAIEKVNALHSAKVESMKAKLDRVDDMKQDADEKIKFMKSQYESQILALNATITSKDIALHSALQGSHVEEMRGIIRDREAELRMLKSSNHIKGVTGETMLMDFLKKNFRCGIGLFYHNTK